MQTNLCSVCEGEAILTSKMLVTIPQPFLTGKGAKESKDILLFFGGTISPTKIKETQRQAACSPRPARIGALCYQVSFQWTTLYKGALNLSFNWTLSKESNVIHNDREKLLEKHIRRILIEMQRLHKPPSLLQSPKYSQNQDNLSLKETKR